MGRLGGVGAWVLFVWGGSFLRAILDDPGMGSKVRFWDDVWCGDRPLKVAFSGLFNIASCKEAIIADNVERSNGAI